MQIPATIEPSFHFYSLSEQAITIEFGQEINEGILRQVSALNAQITKNPFPGFYAAVPAYTTLTVFFDPLQVNKTDKLRGTNCFEKISGYLKTILNQPAGSASILNETIVIPVCYGGDFGPDLEDLAQVHNLTPGEIISLHSSATYKVYMIGFVPGFAYLGGMPALLSSPRKQTPRKAIPPGSVGIAGGQTGIYSLETPGGWQIIGRTPLKMFDANSLQPALLKAGDHVVFKPIDKKEFGQIAIK